MKAKLLTKFIAPIIPCLMAASASTYYSQAYGIAIDSSAVEGLVASDTTSTTIMSTRNDKMADLLLSYDVFSMKHYSMKTVDRPHFSVFF